MSTFDYLLTGFMTLVVICCWIAVNAFRQVGDGYEDAHGFHVGSPQPRAAAARAAHAPQRAVPTAAVPLVESVSVTLAGAGSLETAASTTSDSPFGITSQQGAPSALYRRYRRSVQTRSPVSTAVTAATPSISPFELQCAATRARANQVQSGSPFDALLSQKSASPKT